MSDATVTEPAPLPVPLDTALPVLVAPMAGGPSTPDLVIAASEAGSLGQLAAGYLSVERLAEQIGEVRARTDRFGVNLFVPGPAPTDRPGFTAYRERLRPAAERSGVWPLPDWIDDDDAWDAKVSWLVEHPVPLVSFTFAIPDERVIRALRDAGSVTVQTITTPDEAALAASRGVDALVVQSVDAGGHSAITDPTASPAAVALPDLLAQVAARVRLPLIGAGGVATAADVRSALAAGARRVAVGTAVLRAPESGASALHKAALADPRFDRTVLTRAFTGRVARSLANRFALEHEDAPAAYPQLHHLTRPLRAASTAAGDADGVNLWAGAGWRSATEAPLADTLRRLSGLAD